MAVVMHVRVVEHDLAAPPEGPAVVRLALHEAVDEPPAEVLGPGPCRQIQARVPDRLVDPVEVEGVLHHAVADPVAPAGPRPVAHEHDLGPRQLHPR
jgi:hypothetical protein